MRTDFDCSQIIGSMKEEQCSTQMGITRTVRDLRPSHYLVQIDSYSFLGNEKYEFGIFEAGGYRWRLVLYPDGDTKRNGKGYVSLYLAIAGIDDLPPGWEVNAIIKLFVLDQTRDKYLAIQGGEGAASRFYDVKPEHGFPRFIPLDVFKNSSSGYLIDDSCVLGAEVFVLKPTCKLERPFFTNQPMGDTFTWKIDNFLTLDKETDCYSEAFLVSGICWKLQIDPKRKGTVLSLFLIRVGSEAMQVVDAEFNLRVRDQVNGKHHEDMFSNSFSSNQVGHGLNEFITLRKLVEPSKGFICNGTVIVEVEFTKIKVKYV